jgi:hypothetical protein
VLLYSERISSPAKIDGAFWKLIKSNGATSIPRITVLLSALFAAGFLGSQTQAAPRAESFSFDVKITLSEQAAQWLKKRNERIVISADYTGQPKPTMETRANQVGMIDLAVEDIEAVGASGVIHVTGTKVNLSRVNWIEGPIMLNVNVFSARHASEDNVLACDFFDGKLQSARRSVPELHCSLIRERNVTLHRE